jgi:site-specific DNA-methyltransferase (cytosine-N4-specific)
VFPPKLIEPMILAGSKPGDVILDPFGGSGTVGMVAQMHSRRAVLIDLNPDYLAQCLTRNAQSPLGLES